MEEKKPSTQDILAKIRAQKAGGATPTPSPATETPPAANEPPSPESMAPVEAAAAPVPAAPASAAPAAKPGSTKDILAAIRKQGAGAATPAAGPAAETTTTVTTAAPSAPTATPGSTKDIMAAIRAQKAGGAAAPAAAAAGTGAPAKKTAKPAAAPAGERPSVQEMLKAVREGKWPEVAGVAEVKPAAAAPPKVAPPMPAKPAAKGKATTTEGRRNFLWALFATPFALAWTALAATTGISLLATARFMFPNVLVEPPSRFKVGATSDFPLNTVGTRFTSQYGVWIVHTDQYDGRNLLYALISVCTHLGCTPSWLDGEQKFKCPCHGSGFYITGINFEGPAPRPLERAGVRIAEDGMVEVDKSVKFQEEMGQWADPNSFVELA